MVRRHTPDEQALGAALAKLQAAVRDLQVVDGTQLARSVQKVKDLIVVVEERLNDIPDEVQAALDDLGVYTVAEVDSLIANPPGNVTTTGRGTFSTGLTSTGAFNELLTGGGTYRGGWIHEDGRFGYVPSSERFKQDIEALAANVDVLLQLEVVSFRYIAAVADRGDAADVEVGFIAERVHDLGVHWLVDYETRLTEAGKLTPVPYAPEFERVPFGIRYERIGMAALLVAQHSAEQYASLEARVAALGG